MSIRRKLSSVVLATPLILAGLPLTAGTTQPDETLPGFKANQVHQSGGVDHVNLFNGDPGIVIPLGPEYPLSHGLSWQLRATYTSKFWTFHEMETVPGLRWAYVSGFPTLGIGWGLHLGYVNAEGAYVSPTGARHYFLYDFATGYWVSRDGSGLRRTGSTATGFIVEFPDGTKQFFYQKFFRVRPAPDNSALVEDFSDQPWGADGAMWGMTAVVDQFGTQVLTAEYLNAETGSTADAWKIRRIRLTGRTSTPIVWNWSTSLCGGLTWPVVDSISFPSANGSLTVSFDRLAASFVRNNFDTAHLTDGSGRTPTDGTVNAPYLMAIRMSGADGQGGSVELASYRFQYNGSLPDRNVANGTLREITQPTGGRISYIYSFTAGGGISSVDLESVGCPAGGPPQVPDENPPRTPEEHFRLFMDRSAAVATRIESVPGLADSVTTYCRRQAAPMVWPGILDLSRVARQVVVSRPDGNGGSTATKHIFTVEVLHNDGEPSRAGLEVVRRYYPGADVTGDPIRSLVYCYDSDGSYGPSCGYKNLDGSLAGFVGIHNIRQQNEATWYGVNPTGGGDCSQSNFPGCWQRTYLGWHASALEFATQRVSSNQAFLLYDNTGDTTTAGRYRDHLTVWTPRVDASHWLPKLFSSKSVTDRFLAGTCPVYPCSATTSYSFNTENGFLNGFSTTDASFGTLTHTFSPDAAGNPLIETVTGSWPGAGSYVTRHTFLFGQPVTSSRDGLPAPWKGLDVSRESVTGVVTASRDPNGLSTSYTYDALGRLTRATPPEEAATTYCYRPWNPTTGQPAHVLAKKGSAFACTTNDGVPADGSGSFEAFVFDGNGRVTRYLRRNPNPLSGGGYFSFRETRYNTAGFVSYVGEWAPCPSGTDVAACFNATALAGTGSSNFDFLGRARAIRLPDNNFVTKSFDDPSGFAPNSDRTEITTVWNVGGQVAYSAVRRDVLGRPLHVAEPGQPPFGPVTCYSHDTLDKLVSVNVGCSGQQIRTFSYDTLGFLRSEAHPEKGSTSYLEYDALGNLTKKQEGGLNYRYGYDAAGRLLTLKADAQTEPTTLYLQNSWDGTAGPTEGYPKGRLTRRSGWNPSIYADSRIKLTEDLTWAGLGGRLSRKTATVSNGAASPVASWTYNSLGLVATESYPRIDPSSGTFTVTTSYSSGLPVALSANNRTVVSSATYNASGGLAAFMAGNGVTTTIASDPNGMPRPRRISTSDGSFDTGNYAYDGAGNILSIGPDYFAYDPNSRLLWANYPTGFQSYAYDTFGNLISKAGASITVDPTTNRLTAALYDARGNVTRLGNETYSYDALNRQTKHDAPGSSWTYLLDGADERIVKAIPAGGNVLRREAARIILQAMGEPPRSACAGYFSQDVPCNDPDRGWIEKFYEKGITSGCVPPPNGKYCPDSTTTRAQMAVFLASGMAGSGAAVPSSGTVPGVGPYVCTAGGTSLFGDVPAADVFCKFIHYIFATGVTGGCSTNPRLYCPNDTTSHWQMGYFVSRGWNAFQYVPPGAIYTFRGAGTQVLSEFQDSKVSKDYIYLGNQLVATNESAVGGQPAGWKFHVTDHLGSVRFTTNESRQVVESRKFWPWGEDALNPPGIGRMAFAGMELDLEATHPRYYDHARNLETGYGRFLSPDKLSGHVEDPQSWNRYTYTRNNPLKYVDPDGNGTMLAEALAGAFERAGAALQSAGATLNRGGPVGVALDTTLSSAGSLVGAAGDIFRVGDAVGDAVGSGARGDDFARALATDLRRGSALALMLVTPLRGVGVEAPAAGEVTTLKPGPFAGGSISARGPGRSFTTAERAAIDKIGRETGCHTCGTTTAGTKSGHFVPDHQPPNALNPPGAFQQLYPHCSTCSFPRQANEVRKALQEMH